jgi:hypothetical protein
MLVFTNPFLRNWLHHIVLLYRTLPSNGPHPAILTLSRHMLIHNQHGDSAATDECHHMIKFSVPFLWWYTCIDYIVCCYCILCQHIHECFVCLHLSSGSHNLNSLSSQCQLHITVCHMVVAWCHFPSNLELLASRSENTIPCLMRMKNLLVIC